MRRRAWTGKVLAWVLAGMLIWPAVVAAQSQQKGTGMTGGISGGTGETGGTKDIEDEQKPPGTFHPKTSPQGWGRLKGKPPTGAASQGTRGRQIGTTGAEAQIWEPGATRTKVKPPVTAGGEGLGLTGEQTPQTKQPKQPKGPKGPNLPAARPEAEKK